MASTRLLISLFVIGLLVLPVASASDVRKLGDGTGISGDAVTVCETVHSEGILWGEEYQNAQESVEEGSFGDDEENPTDPSYRACLTARGVCTTKSATSTEVETKSRGHWVIFFWGSDLKTTTTTTTVTTIECEGSYLFTVTYSGGVGQRQALTSVTSFHAIDGIDKTSGPAESAPCSYFGGYSRCTTSMEGEWGGAHTHPGQAPSELETCVEYEAKSDITLIPLPGLDETLDSTLCFDALKLSVGADMGSFFW